MRKCFKALFVLLILSSCFIFTSCSSFFGEDMTVYTIKEVNSKLLENGDTQVTITYVNEEQKPLVFVVPKGEEGAKGMDGTGIKEIKIDTDEKLNQTITIYYTDESLEPVSYVVPCVVSITEVTSEFDEETGKEVLTIHYSDGTVSNPIYIPSGKDGVGIESIENFVNLDYSVTLIVTLSNGEATTILVPAPQKGDDGEPGRGIESVVSSIKGDKYCFTINYTDETSDELEFNRPNKWYSEAGAPKNNIGINGDLWYNLVDNSIYHKENGNWVNLINLSDEATTKYTVRFELEGGSFEFGTPISYEVISNRYFTSSGYKLPIPTKEGFVFKGWYTNKLVDPTVGCFTDLTPVCSDLKLYAVWEQIN